MHVDRNAIILISEYNLTYKKWNLWIVACAFIKSKKNAKDFIF